MSHKPKTDGPHPRREPRFPGELTLQAVEKIFSDCSDFARRPALVGGVPGRRVTLCYINGMVRGERINDYILRPLAQSERLARAEGEEAFRLLEEGALYNLYVQRRTTLDQAALQALHRLRVGDALQVQHIHQSAGPAARDVLPDLQLRGLQVAADHGGVGADGLHEGLPHPLQGGLVLRLPHGALLLRGHRQGEGVGLPWEEQGAAAQDQIVYHVVQGGPPAGRHIIEGPVLEQGQQLPLRGPAELAVLGQGAEHVIVEPLVPGHAQQVAHGDPPALVPVEVHRPLHVVGTAGKGLLQVFPGKGPVKLGLLPGVGGGLRPLRVKHAHLLPPLAGVVFAGRGAVMWAFPFLSAHVRAKKQTGPQGGPPGNFCLEISSPPEPQ